MGSAITSYMSKAKISPRTSVEASSTVFTSSSVRISDRALAWAPAKASAMESDRVSARASPRVSPRDVNNASARALARAFTRH
jgi:hypothetical protein